MVDAYIVAILVMSAWSASLALIQLCARCYPGLANDDAEYYVGYRAGYAKATLDLAPQVMPQVMPQDFARRAEHDSVA